MGLQIIALSCFLFIVRTRAEGESPMELYRLPDKWFPYHYEVELTLPYNFEKLGKFYGKTKLLFTVKTETNEIIFHSNRLIYTKQNIHLVESSIVNSIFNVKTFDLFEKYHKAKVVFDRPLKTGANYTLLIDHFEGALDMDMHGFYRAKYKNKRGEVEWIATTQFEPTHARRAFPCFDEPSYKATFNVILNHPNDYHALSNANIKEVRTFTDSKQTLFEKTPRMSTYLVAFAVSKFVSLTSSENNIKHAVWSSVEVITLGQYALTLSPKLIGVMEAFTNVPYLISNLSTINHITVPDFSAGAMENWGLITYRESALLWNPQTSSSRHKQRVASIVAHELSHMWFGNLVTPKWWTYTWLSEGFARFFEYMALAEVETDWGLENQFVVEQHQRVLVQDSLDKAKPITNYNIFTPSEVSGMFDTYTYSKGGSIVRMMYSFLGKEVFYKGLQSYLYTNKFNDTTPEDLFNAFNNYILLTNPLPAHMTDVMSAWTEKPGFPLVTAQLSPKGHMVLQQYQYSTRNITTGSKWYVPISYTTSEEKNFDNLKPKTWLLPDIPQTVVNHVWKNITWIIVNLKSSAFVRVNYDDFLWDCIEKALAKNNFDDIPFLNRAQLVDDALNLARADIISYKRAFSILSFLRKELDYYPWYSAFNGFSYLIRRIGPETRVAQLLNSYILYLMQSWYRDATSSYPSHQIGHHKQVLAFTWGCKLQLDECVSQMQDLFNSLKVNGTMFNPNYRDVAYCTAVRYATDSENWEFLWKRLNNRPSSNEIPTLLSALGCTNDENLLNRYLNESITEDSVIRKQDGQTVFNSVISGNPKGVDIGLKFLIENFQSISIRYGGMNSLTTIISGVADRLTTKEQVSKLENFIDTNKEALKDAVTSAGTAIENAKRNLVWTEENEKELLECLETDELTSTACVNCPSLIFASIVALVNILKVLCNFLK